MTCTQSFAGIEENIGTVDVDVEHPHDVSDDRMETEHSSGKRTLMQKSCVKQNLNTKDSIKHYKQDF